MIKPFAFVLIPFTDEFNDIYRLGIKATADEQGVVAERVDEQNFSETILERIYRQIDAADFIIADMSGRNPNVFYEVGYAHAKGKLCTLLTKTADDIPFDLKHHRHLVYEGSIVTLKKLLTEELGWLKREHAQKKASVFDIQLKSSDGLLTKTDYSATAEVDLIFDIRNSSQRRSPEIEAIYFQTSDGWTFRSDGVDCPSTSVEGAQGALRHFVRAPVQRLSPDAWAQVKLSGRKRMWSKWAGEELKDKYRLAGAAQFEIATSEGIIRKQIDLDLSVEEFPF